METLFTERLELREFHFRDIDDFHDYCKNPNVGPGAGWRPHKVKEESINILDQFIQSREVWAIVLKDINEVIGSIGLHRDSKRTNRRAKMLGYVLSEDYWGQGIATEAARRIIEFGFEDLKLDIISVYHFPFNKKSKRVIEKCGFKYEGTMRRATILYNGDVLDDVCYSLTKDEYYNIKDKGEF